MTKRDFFAWLKTTKPPRVIETHAPYGTSPWLVYCSLSIVGRVNGKMLSEPRSSRSAEQQRAKYARWLKEFETKE